MACTASAANWDTHVGETDTWYCGSKRSYVTAVLESWCQTQVRHSRLFFFFFLGCYSNGETFMLVLRCIGQLFFFLLEKKSMHDASQHINGLVLITCCMSQLSFCRALSRQRRMSAKVSKGGCMAALDMDKRTGYCKEKLLNGNTVLNRNTRFTVEY